MAGRCFRAGLALVFFAPFFFRCAAVHTGRSQLPAPHGCPTSWSSSRRRAFAAALAAARTARAPYTEGAGWDVTRLAFAMPFLGACRSLRRLRGVAGAAFLFGFSSKLAR